MTAFNLTRAYSFNQGSGLQASGRAFTAFKDLGTLETGKTLRVLGRASQSATPTLEFSFASTISRPVGISLTDRTAGGRAFNFRRIGLFNNATGDSISSPTASLSNNRYGFQASIAPGNYTVRFSPRGSGTFRYTLRIVPE